MALAGIEVRYLTQKITDLTKGHYVANVYGIARETILIKLHHPEHADVFLMVSTRGVWPTDSKIDPIEPNSMVRRLRKSLARLRLTRVTQPGEERIVILDFEGLDTSMHIICEFFGGGNIILCDSTQKIHALLHAVEVRHRTLRVGEQYTMPPASEFVAIDAKLDDILNIQQTSLSAAKWLARNVGLPSRYIEKIFATAKVDPKCPGPDLDKDAIMRIHAALGSIVTSVIDGKHEPETMLQESGSLIVNPVKLIDGATTVSDRTFEQLVDEAFIAEILNDGRTIASEKTEKRTSELKSQISEQTNAIELVRQRAAEISKTAQTLQQLAATGVISMQDDKVITELGKCGALLIQKRGQSIIRVAGCEIIASLEASLYATASALFDESKVQAFAESTIVARQKKIQKELELLQQRATAETNLITVTHVRKKAWYERYRWFHTSDGQLAVGGRDASSNTSLVRKRLEPNDIIFHADLNGSPFFVLKGGQTAVPSSLKEVAHATVCFSRAWRVQMHGTDAFWVYPQQIKRAAPSGQYLPKGSFAIEGKRNVIKAPTLRLGIGAVDIGGIYVVSCGPPAPIRAATECYSIIEPGGSSQTDTAKKIKSELTRINERFGEVDLDEIARALPAGFSRVVESVNKAVK